MFFDKTDTTMLRAIKTAILLLIATFSTSCNHRAKSVAEPINIACARAESQILPYTKQFIAPISASYHAVIQPRISGFLTKSSFSNGMPVKRGQLIFTLDNAPQRANRLAAEASLSSVQLHNLRCHIVTESLIMLHEQDGGLVLLQHCLDLHSGDDVDVVHWLVPDVKVHGLADGTG